MGKAILTGILNDMNGVNKNNYSVSDTSFKPQKFIACVSGDESAQKTIKLFGESVTVVAGQNVKGVSEADVVLLCTKPQIAKTILTDVGMAEALENKLIISILAGIQEGMTVINCPANINADDRAFAMWVFSTLGRVRVLDEKHMDPATGLSGSGPAFACVVLESLADGGVMMGLPRDVALELAAQALQGAARMVLKTGKHPAEIKDSVTTPAGCTIAGLLTMEDGKIRSTLARAVQEAANVASTLGKVQVNK
ncbi:19319_t:CDS:2 [Cetraspora pellucida]|uniref:19319_t:CDS:1 n=1 Tax=Cetraspora pellucida TaxID=1433469 RepID=A0A9N9EC72_9GLOM|nr:19319_t:CDS:2 [Cetraspora pellucida]